MEAAEAMVTTEHGHELGLGGLGTEVVAGECGRNKLGLHEELGWGRVLVDLLRLGGEQRLLRVHKVQHSAISRSVVVRIDGDPIFAGGSGVYCGSLESRMIDLSGPPFRFCGIVVVDVGGGCGRWVRIYGQCAGNG